MDFTNSSKVFKVLAHLGFLFEDEIERFLRLVGKAIGGDEEHFQEAVDTEAAVSDEASGVREAVHG